MQGFQKQLKQPAGLKRVATDRMNKRPLVPFLLGEQGGGGVWLRTPPEKFEISKPSNAISRVLEY